MDELSRILIVDDERQNITDIKSTESSRKLIKKTPLCGAVSRARELLIKHHKNGNT